MPASKRSVFRNCALLSRLVSKEQIEEAVAAICSTEGGPPTPVVEVSDNDLAAMLIDMEVLTTYQADQLKAGRTKLTLGPYIITDWIGQGGMGQVFKAVHEMMGRECAVKVLPLSKSTPEAVVNFRREIRTQAKLDHPNLVRAYDAGEDGNVHYLVTEYVPGTDLRRLVRSQGKLNVQQAASIIMQAAEGLDYAHECDLIHRDVKPGNILVTPDGVAKVSDLGLAGFIHEADDDPRSGKIVGTADYLAPEQIRNPLDVSNASDIYALGCTLYYAITGKVPFPGGSPSNKAMRHLQETPWHPRRFNDDVGDDFVDVIADMMEKDPKKRIPTAAEVAERLRPWASDSLPIMSQQMSKSPWMPPPLPSAEADEVFSINLHDTGSATYDPADFVPNETESASQISQGTNPVTSAGQETRKLREGDPKPPPLIPVIEMANPETFPRSTYILITAGAALSALVLGLIVGLILGITLW